MIENLPILIASVCGFLLICLVFALIFSSSFRDDMLGGEGEASVAGVLSVKGVAIVLLCGIFLGGLIYPLSMTPTPVVPTINCDAEINNTIVPLSTYSNDLAPSEIIKLTNQKIVSLISENLLLKTDKTSSEINSAKISEDYSLLDEQLINSASQLKQCSENLGENKASLNVCIEGDKGVLAKLNAIQDDIREFSPAIDFSWVPNEKKGAAYRVLEVLGRLGHYGNPPSYEPELARLALINFQKSKNILPDDTRKQGLLGRKTFLILIADYISGEQNGG